MKEVIWLTIKTAAQFIWTFIKGITIGLWNHPTLLFFIIIAIVGSLISAKLFSRK